jgi:hypothetical protein
LHTRKSELPKGKGIPAAISLFSTRLQANAFELLAERAQ